MKDIIKIAWRNLWRNKRRTLITASSIFFALFFAIFMRSFQLGTYGYMIEQSIESYTGYLQIQNPDYFDDPTIDNSFNISDEMIDRVKNHENIKAVAPRVETFALASTGTNSKGVMVSGIDPVAEAEVSNPEHRVVKYRFTEEAIKQLKNDNALPPEINKKIETFKYNSYSSTAKIELDLDFENSDAEKYIPVIEKYCRFESNYLSPNDDGVLIADRLSRYLKISVGDSLILMGQGYHGVSAAGIYPVRGIIKMASPDLDNKIIYMSLPQINNFLGLNNQITSMVINLRDKDEMFETQNELKKIIGNDKYVVKNWEEISPTLKQQIQSDNVSGQVFIFILYVIVFFGIFGTVIMMVAERKREFGVMVAIGMKRKKLSMILSAEMLFLSILGVLAGIIVTIPVLLYGHYYPLELTGNMARMMEDMGFDPIMPLALFEPYFFMQILIVFIMIILACLVPVRSIQKLDAIKAIHA
ncbi:MAG: FtsX-like permease family protein [Prolixibacteraceae bacterium]|nr:FtsX-like permease family protein [Prolixibacteraceae bacterium]